MATFFRNTKRRAQEGGFTLLMSVLMGLLMTLVVLSVLSRGMSDRAIAAQEIAKEQSLALAEAGAVTYQSLLVTYPLLALYNDKGGTKSWANAPALAANVQCNSNTPPLSTTDLNQIATLATSQWQNIDPNDPTQGQFKLVDYQFQPDDPSAPPNTAPGTGTLRIEGRTRNPDQGSVTSRVVLSFKVDTHASTSSGTLLDGIWSGAFKYSGGSAGEIQANICDATGNNSGAQLQPYLGTLPSPPYPAGQIATVNQTSSPFPDLPAEGNSFLIGSDVNTIPAISISGASKVCQLPMLGIAQSSCPSLPTLSESSDDSVYRYNIQDGSDGSIYISSGKIIFGRTGTETIIAYLYGDFYLSSARIEVVPGTKVILYVHSGFKLSSSKVNISGKSDNFQVYYYGIPEVDLNSSQVSGFIFAPNATKLKLSSTALTGSVWAKSWDSSSSTFKAGVADPTALKIDVPSGAVGQIKPAFTWRQEQAS